MSLKEFFTVAAATACIGQIVLVIFSYNTSYPTTTTIQKTDIETIAGNNVPSFVLCPLHNMDLEKLKDKGYSSIADFFLGNIMDGTYGWGGFGNESFSDILDSVSYTTNYNESFNPAVYTMMTSHDSDFHDVDLFWIRVVVFPNGYCYRLLTSLKTKFSGPYHRIVVEMKSNVSAYAVKVTDPDQWSFTPQMMSFRQDKIEHASDDLNEFRVYNLDLTVHRSDPLDPKARCTEYGSKFGYNKCFCTEVVKKFDKELGCTPPWVHCKVLDPRVSLFYNTDDQKTCMNPTSQNLTTRSKVQTMLRYLAEYQRVETCQTSCQSMMIQSTLTNKLRMRDNVVEIVIDPIVTIVETRRSNTPMDMLVSVTSALSLWVGWCLLTLMEFTAIWLPATMRNIKMKFNSN
jgi:hypothetical protein